MQKSGRNENKGAKSPVAIRTCPQCGNEHVRRASTHTGDGLLKTWFFKAYRCQACRHRFWLINPFRLVLLAGIILVLVPVIGALWMVSNHEQATTNSDQIVSNDPVKSLAEKGDAEAELKMGLRYTSNVWGVKDDKTAVQWFEKAASHGQVEAQYRYGMALLEGQGVVQDFKTAFYWLDKAARQGFAQAQFAVGKMYHDGDFIKRDIEQAYLWFNLAAAQGLDKAASARDLAGDLLTPNQLVLMQEQARRISISLQSALPVNGPKVEVTKSQSEVKADESVNR